MHGNKFFLYNHDIRKSYLLTLKLYFMEELLKINLINLNIWNVALLKTSQLKLYCNVKLLNTTTQGNGGLLLALIN